jgi:hypothetical protein
MQDGSASNRQAMLSRFDRELAIGGVKSRIRITHKRLRQRGGTGARGVAKVKSIATF